MARGQSGLKEQIKAENRDTRDYRQFLSKFAVLREEQMVDPDSLTIFFTATACPFTEICLFLEPQETREVKKIQTLSSPLTLPCPVPENWSGIFKRDLFCTQGNRKAFSGECRSM